MTQQSPESGSPMGSGIAIVGMAVLLPGAPDLPTYWQNLVTGVDAITEVPADRWDPEFYHPQGKTQPAPDRLYCRRGGFVDEIAEVEVTRFGIMPSSVADAEPDQLIALHVAAAAIADAGGESLLPDRDRIGIVLGRGGYIGPGLARLDQRVRTAQQLVRTLAELVPDLADDQLERVRNAFTDAIGPTQPDAAIGLVPNLAASRVANRLDLRGPAYTVDAACASSLVAVDQAIGELATGRCDLMLAGGVHHCHDITFWSVFTQLGALSAGQQIRPFDSRADGILIGEGTGVVVLKRLADAKRDGDRIYAVIRGSAVASDGRVASLSSPDAGGQVRAVRQAWKIAGLDPAESGSVGLIEAHGTATRAGDRVELETLREVFGPADDTGRAVIGTVKSMIGHTMPAAGVAGLVKAALALHHQTLPPTLHCEEPNPALDLTRFEPIATAKPWSTVDGQPRRAGVNAFGFGGINAHVVLEEADSAPHTVEVREPDQMLLFSGENAAEIAALLDQPDDVVRAVPAAAGGRCRLAIVDPTAKRLGVARKVVARGAGWRGRNDVWFSPRPMLTDPSAKTAFIFPGLEAEFTPNVRDIASHFALPAANLTSANLGLHSVSVIRMGRLLDAALRRLRIVPDGVGGHSVGEWTAMISAGIYAAKAADEMLESVDPDSLRVPGVEFAVVGCSYDQAAEAIAGRPDVVVSHENSPNQTIVCGPAAEIAEVVRDFRAQRVICQVLPFRSGFHTPMLAPYLDQFRRIVEDLTVYPPSVPVWSATTASVFPSEPDEVHELYVRHMLEPVRFRSLINEMYAAGFRIFVQVGPGQLGSLIDDTLGDAEHLTVPANSSQRSGLNQLRRVAAAVWVEGGSPDFAALLPDGPAAPTRKSVKLNLSGSSVRLGAAAHGLVRTSESTLDKYAAEYPLAAELDAMLRETERTAVAVLRAAAAPQPSIPATLRVSTETMPYLLDHCFAEQREGWPDENDRWPVVPATTIVRLMMDTAEKAVPGRVAVGVLDAKFNRWMVAAPAIDVPLTVTRTSADLVEIGLGDYARGIVRMADQYPTPVSAWPLPDEPSRVPTINLERFYLDRYMFHGPRFQGMQELLSVGERHIRAVFRAPTAPGGLLDNVGQLLGLWLLETQTTRRVVFPVSIANTRFFADEPAPGSQVGCALWISSITDAVFEFDAQLTCDGVVFAEIKGWQDYRFDSSLEIEPAYRMPQRKLLSHPQPGGWLFTPERWPRSASRNLYLRKYLNADEQADFDGLPPKSQAHWLLGRIAVKDAIRAQLWEQGWDGLFPAEVWVRNEPSGRPYVTGRHRTDLPEFSVSLAHCREVGVALARPGLGVPVGIDVEEVVERAASTVAVALSEPERRLLTALVETSGESAALWFARFWTAKEAVAKAEGTGLGGRPRLFTVTEAAGDELAVLVRGRTYRLRCATVHNPADLPEREYVVTWTIDEERER
jgi:acyl transferase domain-containing protein/phosphopantetheinyl transferase